MRVLHDNWLHFDGELVRHGTVEKLVKFKILNYI